ncbi:hypothetical protein JR316_0000183 [Psilocybe cubensis]|uniref:Late embryogenesis abundant protein LEA-2 subgroup domain-containing protein n=2 Tax=Psilocybe cubensis TaxID=181762 RepID=A0A8H7Y9F5_PSICU|nr:hypothetical protein JR316_0000183 [Psilocybe cubensis]KAH9486119.1 hypothetical protein JR316_0000183 [Psilocybe cubensis]
MAPISTFLVGFIGYLLLSVGASPTEIGSRDLIGDVINAIGLGLVTKINAYISVETFGNNLLSVDFDIKNPLLLELTIDRVVSKAGINGTVYASFDHTFTTPVVVKALNSANSGKVPDVLLDQGVEKSLDIIPLLKLDLISTDVYLRAATIKGKLGIPIPIKGLKQKDIPTSYQFV